MCFTANRAAGACLASDDGSGSFRLASRQAQARQIKLALLRVSVWCDARHHDGGDRVQPHDNLSRFVEPPHMRIAGSEITMRLRVARIVLDREAEFRHCLIEAPRRPL